MSVLYKVTAQRGNEPVWTFIEAGCADEAKDMAMEVFGDGDVIGTSEPASDREIREYIADLVVTFRGGSR